MPKFPILKVPFYYQRAKLEVDENGNEITMVPCPWYLELDEAGESYHSRRCEIYINLGGSSLKQYRPTATLWDKYGNAATTEKEIPPERLLGQREEQEDTRKRGVTDERKRKFNVIDDDESKALCEPKSISGQVDFV